MKLKTALDHYLLQLAADGRSAHTRAQAGRHLRLLGRWLADEGHDGALERISHEQVAAFLAGPLARLRADGGERRPTSANALRSSLKGYFRYCHGAGYVHTNPARLVRRALCEGPLPRGLSREEEDRLLTALEGGRGRAARRDRVLFVLLLRTGLRISAALSLDLRDVDLDRQELWVRRGKGSRPQRVLLPAGVTDLLAGLAVGRSSGPLFAGRGGRSLTRRQADRRLKAWLARAGCRPAGAHMLRHTLGRRIYDASGDLLLVAAALGHAGVASSQRYAEVTESRLRAALNRS